MADIKMAVNGRLTTHVLDLSSGRPAAGVKIRLYKLADSSRELLEERFTNADGRLDQPLLSGENMQTGSYELEFDVGGYFRERHSSSAQGCAERRGVNEAAGSGNGFLEEVPVRFRIDRPGEHYHVPLLVAPGGYSTYRGS